jgi:hypothetical protein
MDEPHHPHGIGSSPECLLCPICVLLQALSSSRPEVTRHLIAAGRELSLALSVVLDSHQEAADAADQRLRRINID